MSVQTGIWPPYVAFYVEAMLFNTTAAMASVEDILMVLDAIENHNIDLKDLDHHSILDSLQNIVSHAAMISKFFWPSREKPMHLARAEYLRGKFEVKEENPLRSRNLRDYLEHFDERLDGHLSNGIAGDIIPSYVGYAPQGELEVPTHIFRAFYVNTGVFKTLNESYEMQPIIDEIGRIHQLLLRFSTI